VAAIIEPVPVEIALLALVLPLFVILWAIFGVKLTISDQGIHQSFGGLTYKADWQGIAEITNRGLKTADPCLIYNKWNPLVWRMELYGQHTDREFVTNIPIKSFEPDWPEGPIGREIFRYVPELVLDYRNKHAAGAQQEKA
jgi:hypothetical protein